MIQIGLYNSESGFPEFDKSYKSASLKANKETVVHTFTSIPAGTFAIAVWHDENENEQLDKNMFGAPKEKYGFSNNKIGTMGPPDFSETTFNIKDNEKITLTINMK